MLQHKEMSAEPFQPVPVASPTASMILEPRLELQKFLRERGLSYHDAGKFLHLSAQAVCNWVKGHRIPGPRARQQIELLTNGRIKAMDWETSAERERRHVRAELEARAAASRPKRRLRVPVVPVVQQPPPPPAWSADAHVARP